MDYLNVSNILDKDEIVKETIKPNKRRYVLISWISSFPFILVGIALIVFSILIFTNVIEVVDEKGNPDNSAAIFLMIFGCLAIAIVMFSLLYKAISYKKVEYYITNKRAIIRHGFIGVDYKSLNLSAILSLDVSVDFLDKIVKPVTGSIVFGSATNPVGTNNKASSVAFAFDHIEEPYETYRKIKEAMEEPIK